MTRRLFVALLPDEKAIDQLQRFLALVGPPGGTPRQTAASGWHITSVFLGDVDEHQCAEFSEQLGELLAGIEPFPLALAGGGAFGPADVARTWWAGVHDRDEMLPEINQVCLIAARRAKITVAAEKYFAHLTIYRGRPRPTPAWVASWRDYRSPTWTADAVHLMESVRTPAEAYYRTIDRFELTSYPN